MRIAITGSTGLIGRALDRALTADGHEVVRLVRSPSERPSTAVWTPATGEIRWPDDRAIDAVVHLAGENVAGGRWTEARKQRIADSRGPTTKRLCRTLAQLPTPPRVLVSASATGIYGDRGDEVLDEASPTGDPDDFLTRVACDWERATEPLAATGTRVVHSRFGIVLDRHGGALQRMLLPFRLGLGGRLGDGNHWMSWITRDDAVRALLHMLGDGTSSRERLHGPVLTVSPQPVTNRTFTRALGRTLRRPTILPVPRFALSMLFGELASVLLASQRAQPRQLLASGFTFRHADIEEAFIAALHTPEQ